MIIFIITTFIFFISSIILTVLYFNKINCPKCPANDCSKSTTNGWTNDNISELDADIITQSKKNNTSIHKVAGKYVNGCGDSDPKKETVACESLTDNEIVRKCIIKDIVENISYKTYNYMKSKGDTIDLRKYYAQPTRCESYLSDHTVALNGLCYNFDC